LNQFQTNHFQKKDFCDPNEDEQVFARISNEITRRIKNTEDTLLPPEYVPKFFKTLLGFGVKMSHLAAEAIYKKPIGPAIDVHFIRFFCEHELIHCTMTSQMMSDIITKTFPPRFYHWLNEIPATIGQILRKSDPSLTSFTINIFLHLAQQHNFFNQAKCFLTHYGYKIV